MHGTPPRQRYARTNIGQTDCAAMGLARSVPIKKWHYKKKLAHSLHTSWPSTGTRRAVFVSLLHQTPAEALAVRMTAEIDCSAMGFS